MEKFSNFVFEKFIWLLDKTKELWKLIQEDPETYYLKIILGILIFAGIAMLYFMIELIVDLANNKRIERRGVLLEILPKETTKVKDTESLIRNIHSMLLNTKWRKWLYGRPYMSFEIAAEKDKIKFYIKIPEGYKKAVTERIYATYSEIAIREVKEDYLPEKVWITPKEILIFLYRFITYPILKKKFKVPKNHLSIYGTEMELAYHYVLKLKTKQDKDLLGSILSGMKDLEWHEKVVVQVLARPLDNDWQLKGRKVLEKFERDGKRPKRGSDFANFFSSLWEQLRDEIDVELEESGFKKRRTVRKTRMERKEITVASEKLVEAGFETVIRVMSVGHYKRANKSRVKAITAAFSELDKENRFKRDFILAKKLFYRRTKNRRIYLIDRRNILTTPELANFFLRLPGSELIDEFQDIEALGIKEFAPPKGVETEKFIIGKNIYRGKETLIGLKTADLKRHLVMQGKTGTGKSEWAKTLMKELMEAGNGFMLLEPHGKLSDEVLEFIPEHRRKDIIYFDLFDDYPPAFNFCKVFERKGKSIEDVIEKTTEEVIEIFKRTFREAWSEKNEYYLTNSLKTVIDTKSGDILNVQRLFSDKEYRDYIVPKIKDPQLKHFWKTEFAEKNGKLSPGTESTINSLSYKLGKFLSAKKLLRAVAQDDCIDFKEALDNNKIVIFRLSKDDLSEDRVSFLGGIAIKLLIVAAFARDKSKWDEVYPVFVDECQNFIGESIKTVMYELRKYGVPFVLMHQGLEQFDKVPGLQKAIYGNVGNKVTFAVGRDDAKFFEEEYGPRVDQKDLKGLPSRYGYCKILVDGEESKPFNICSLDRPEVEKHVAKQSLFEIKKHNRENRMHYKDIDKMLSQRINNYKDIDEKGEELEKEESFAEDLSEEYVKSKVIEKIMNEEINIDPKAYIEENQEDQDQPEKTSKKEAAPPIPEEDPPGDTNQEDSQDIEVNINITGSFEDIVTGSKNEISHIEKEEKLEIKKEPEGEKNLKSEPSKALKLSDFIKSDKKPEERKKLEEIKSKQEIAITLENKEDRNIEEDPKKVKVDPKDLWNIACKKEKGILKENKEIDEKDLIGKSLWEVAAQKEKEGEN